MKIGGNVLLGFEGIGTKFFFMHINIFCEWCRINKKKVVDVLSV